MKVGETVAGALAGTLDVRFAKLPGSGRRYQGMIYVGGRHYGHIFLREEDEMYVAKTTDEEFIGAADSLRALRTVVEKHALGS